MRSSLRKLKGFSLTQRHGHGGAPKLDPRQIRNLAQLDELTQASQDMEQMRDCYDALLSAAAATANSVYELSESFKEMGSCLQQRFALNDNEESGKVISMLGKVQLELQTLVDRYRSHVFQTITSPSESLLSELQTVEEMRRQCEEKRNAYEYVAMRYKEKGRSKCGKSESFSMEHLKEAYNEFDEEATLFVFRMRSLKQGQSRSLLTQAARHHAAQLSFFKKALKSLEAVEPHVKMITTKQHIDYHFRGLEDDDDDDDDSNGSDDDSDINHANNDGELSFGDPQTDHEKDFVPTSRNSMEIQLEQLNSTLFEDATKGNMNRTRHKHCFSMGEETRNRTQSAPLFAGYNEKLLQRQPSLTRKLNTYALPTPVGIQRTGSPSHRSKTCMSGDKLSPPYSSQLEGNQKFATMGRIHTPLTEGFTSSRFNSVSRFEQKKIRRQAFSGPLSSKPWPALSASVSGPILRNTVLQSQLSPKASPAASPRVLLSPKISELHELPRPPAAGTGSKLLRTPGFIAHSGPLVSSNRPVVSKAATPLPKPPPALTRSFSIPSSTRRLMELPTSKPLELTEDSGRAQDLV